MQIALAVSWRIPCPSCGAPLSGDGLEPRLVCACGAVTDLGAALDKGPGRSAWFGVVADVIREATGLLAPGESAFAPPVDGHELTARLEAVPPGAEHAVAPAAGWDPRIAWAMDRWIGWNADEWDILDARVFFLVGATSSPAVMAHPAAASALSQARLGMRTTDGLDALLRRPPPPELEARVPVLGARLLEALASNPATPESWLHALAARHEPVVDRALLARRGLPDAILPALLQSDEPTIRIEAGNRVTDPAVLAEISRHPDAWLRAAVADRPALAPEIWVSLARDPEPRVRRRVAANPAAAPAAIRLLRRDPDDRTQEAARASPLYTPTWLDRMLDR